MTEPRMVKAPDAQSKGNALGTAIAILWLGSLSLSLLRWRRTGDAPHWSEFALPLSMLVFAWFSPVAESRVVGWPTSRLYRYLLLVGGALMFAGRLLNLLVA